MDHLRHSHCQHTIWPLLTFLHFLKSFLGLHFSSMLIRSGVARGQVEAGPIARHSYMNMQMSLALRLDIGSRMLRGVGGVSSWGCINKLLSRLLSVYSSDAVGQDRTEHTERERKKENTKALEEKSFQGSTVSCTYLLKDIKAEEGSQVALDICSQTFSPLSLGCPISIAGTYCD